MSDTFNLSPLPVPAPRRRHRWLWIVFAAVISFAVLKFAVLSCGCAPIEPANRVKCANNLKQIGLAIGLYTSQYNGDYPDSFATLLKQGNLTLAVFDCPSTVALPAPGKTDAEIAAQLSNPDYCSYIYLGRNLKAAQVTAATVIAYEPLSNHQEAGSNVLYGDGRVEFNVPAYVQKINDQVNKGIWPVTLP